MKYKLFMIVAILIVMSGCGKGSPDIDYSDYQRQTEEYDRQTEETQRQLDKSAEQLKLSKEQSIESQRQLEESAKYLERAIKHSDRFDTLLKKWEEQAERQDLILEAQEKALKINN